MPWTWLARLLFAAVLYWTARRRSAGAPLVDAAAMRRRVDTTRQAGVIAARVVTAISPAGAGLLLLTVAASTLILGPRWIGGVTAVLTAIFVIAGIQESLRLRADLEARRHHDHVLHIAADQRSKPPR